MTPLLASGQTLPMVASIMGWSPSTTVRMAQRYGYISTDARQAAMEAMTAARPKAAALGFEGEDSRQDPVHWSASLGSSQERSNAPGCLSGNC